MKNMEHIPVDVAALDHELLTGVNIETVRLVSHIAKIQCRFAEWPTNYNAIVLLHAIKYRLNEMYYKVQKRDMSTVFIRIQNELEKWKPISQESLAMLINWLAHEEWIKITTPIEFFTTIPLIFLFQQKLTECQLVTLLRTLDHASLDRLLKLMTRFFNHPVLSREVVIKNDKYDCKLHMFNAAKRADEIYKDEDLSIYKKWLTPISHPFAFMILVSYIIMLMITISTTANDGTVDNQKLNFSKLYDLIVYERTKYKK